MHRILKKYWGYDSFRGIQEDIIRDIMDGRDVLGLMPTGGGKSITFQVPALALPGVCIVISPLIALMKDQVENLKKRNILAAAIFSGMTSRQILQTLDNAVYGGVKILYVSPERLDSTLFQVKLSHMKVSFITIDEAHCICQWGYDFRPSYLNIKRVREIHPGVPILALTATATPSVVLDIQEKLGFRENNCRSMSFRRENLAYIVKPCDDKLAAIVSLLQENPGTAIVYVSSREKTTDIASALRACDIPAEAYNAGLTTMHRNLRQKQWTDDRVRVIVATNAFGMGIDKPDVRLVIHHDCPSSIEAYFQEAGRAGRDGQPAKAILLVKKGDERSLLNRIDQQYPPEKEIFAIYQQINYFYEIGEGYGKGCSYIFNMDGFCRIYHHFQPRVSAALHILSNAGYIDYEDQRDTLSRIAFCVSRDDLYELKDLPLALSDFMQTLLRRYTGLFTSYVQIYEEELAEVAAISEQEVYERLIDLARRRIIRYIPRSKEPLLSFVINRVRDEDFFLPRSSYSLLKERFTERIEKMREYISQSALCRSQLLLEYFGEKDAAPCRRCDVCEAANTQRNSSPVRDFLLQKLADRRQRHISEFLPSPFTPRQLQAELLSLRQEERIEMNGSLIRLKG